MKKEQRKAKNMDSWNGDAGNEVYQSDSERRHTLVFACFVWFRWKQKNIKKWKEPVALCWGREQLISGTGVLFSIHL